MKKFKYWIGLVCLFGTISVPVMAEEQEFNEGVPVINRIENFENQGESPESYFLGESDTVAANELVNQVIKNKLFPEISAALNNSVTKLGYLKGDTLKITLPSKLFELKTDSPIKFNTVGSGRNGFKGKIKLVDFIIRTGSSTSATTTVDPISGEVIVEFTRIEHSITDGNVYLKANIDCDIMYYRDNLGGGLTLVGQHKTVIPKVEQRQTIQTIIADLPNFEAIQNEENTILTVGEAFDATDPFKYINVLSCPGMPEAKYTLEDLPDTSHVGKTTATVILTDVYTRTIKIRIEFTVVDNILAEVVPQTLQLGSKVNTLPYHEWLKDVRLEKSNIGLVLGNVGEVNSYQVRLKEPDQVIETINSTTVAVIITSGEVSAEFSIPVSVVIGDSLIVNNSRGETIFGLSLLAEGNGNYQLLSSKGRNSLAGEQVISGLELAITKPSNSVVKLKELNWSQQYSFNSQEDIALCYQKIISQQVEIGDVISLTQSDSSLSNPFEIYRQSEKLVNSKPTPQVDETIYFVVTPNGFEQLWLNQLQVTNGNWLELYQTTEEIAGKLDDFILHAYQDKGVVVNGFETYPNTQQPGLTTGSLLVSQSLVNNEYQFSYPVEVRVKEGKLVFEVPAAFDFGHYTLGNADQTVNRVNSTKEKVTVIDNRLDSQKRAWRLVARITDTADILGKYAFYVDEQGGNHYFTNSQSIPVLESTMANKESGKITTTQIWSESEGILLQIPKKNELIPQSYKTQIEWSITRGEL